MSSNAASRSVLPTDEGAVERGRRVDELASGWAQPRSDLRDGIPEIAETLFPVGAEIDVVKVLEVLGDPAVFEQKRNDPPKEAARLHVLVSNPPAFRIDRAGGEDREHDPASVKRLVDLLLPAIAPLDLGTVHPDGSIAIADQRLVHEPLLETPRDGPILARIADEDVDRRRGVHRELTPGVRHPRPRR